VEFNHSSLKATIGYFMTTSPGKIPMQALQKRQVILTSQATAVFSQLPQRLLTILLGRNGFSGTMSPAVQTTGANVGEDEKDTYLGISIVLSSNGRTAVVSYGLDGGRVRTYQLKCEQ
jgi:hypothetical protein